MRFRGLLALAVIQFAVLESGGSIAAARDDVPLLIFAASSLAGVLEPALAGSLEGASARIAYGSSGALVRQIEAGAQADVFLSAHADWSQHLVRSGLAIRGSARQVLANSLVIAAAPDAVLPQYPVIQNGLLALLNERRLALGNPAYVPAGAYGRQALEWYGVWASVEPDLVATDSARAAVTLVARGEVPFGLVYTTDARAAGLRVAFALSQDSHPAIIYVAVAVKGGRLERARQFVADLSTVKARNVFTTFGFRPLP